MLRDTILRIALLLLLQCTTTPLWCFTLTHYSRLSAPQWEALQRHGCSQVVYTLPSATGERESATIAESGASNIFFLLRDELVTPPLDGTILPGITRDSVLQLCKR